MYRILKVILFLITCIAFNLLHSQSLRTIVKLSSQVEETSGIEETGKNEIWTFNDSGGTAQLFKTDTLGNILKIVDINGAWNRDWEDIAKDDNGNFYIGNIGNNSNSETDLTIFKIPNPDLASGNSVEANVIYFSYPDQYNFPPADDKRNFDCEALVWYEGYLYLCSKNRTAPFDGITHLYRLPDEPGTYTAEKISSFDTDGNDTFTYWITAADISPDGSKFALLSSDKMWIFYDFSGDDFFSGSSIQINFPSSTQKEAMCFVSNSEVYITDESWDPDGLRLYSLVFDLNDNDSIISNISHTPIYPMSDETTLVSATVSDNESLSSVILSWGTSSGNLVNTTDMDADANFFTAYIPEQPDGTDVFYTITSTDNEGSTTVSNEFSYGICNDYSCIPCLYNTNQTAYNGNIVTIPGKIEAENYNNGCNGVAYYDADFQNEGGQYRKDDVDIEECGEGGYNVGWIKTDEWLNYDITVAQDGFYDFTISSASKTDGGAIRLEMDGNELCSSTSLPVTNDWQVYMHTVIQGIKLPEGEHTLRLIFDKGNVNLDHISISVSVDTQNINLNQGWNLVSLYVQPNDSNMESVFPKAQIIKNTEEFYEADRPEYLNSLTEIVTGKGYLIYNSVTEVVELKGPQAVKASTALKPGWNLVGSNTDIIIEDLPSEITTIKDFDNFFNSSGTENSLHIMEKGKAYFIKASENCTISW